MKRFLLTACGIAVMATSAMAQNIEEGAALYARHCATCHGLEATGGGPMAPVLVLQPPDLTKLTERNEGTFPVERVVMRIDGRDPLVSHGSPMPVYGDFFDGEEAILKAETGQPVLTSVPVVDLLEYLRSVQQ